MTDSRENHQADSRRKRQEKKQQEAELMGEMLFGSIAGVQKTDTQYVNLGERLASPESRTWEAAENGENAPSGYAKSPKPEVRRDERETLEDFPELAGMKKVEKLQNQQKTVSREPLSEKEGFIAMEKENVENRTENHAGNPAEMNRPVPETASAGTVLTGEKEENIRLSSPTLTSSIFSAVTDASERNVFHKYAFQITTIGASVLVIFIMFFVVNARKGNDSTADITPGAAVEQVAEHPAPVPEKTYDNIHAPVGNFPTSAQSANVLTAEPARDANFPQLPHGTTYPEQFTGAAGRATAPVTAPAPYSTDGPVFNPELAVVTPSQPPSAYSYGQTPAARMDYSSTDELPQFNPDLAGYADAPAQAMPESAFPSFETYEKMIAGKAEIPPALQAQPSPRKLSPPPSSLRQSQPMNNQTADSVPAPTYVPLDYPNPTPMNVAPVSPSFGAGAPQTDAGSYQTFDPVRGAGGQIPVTENYIGPW